MVCASARAVGQDARMIYYVEDDTNIRDLTVYALKQAGFEAAGFTCGRDFFKACDEKTPDLVLLDIMKWTVLRFSASCAVCRRRRTSLL